MSIIFNTSNFPKFKGDATTPFIFHLAKSISKFNNIVILAPASRKSLKSEYWDGVKIIRFNYFFYKKWQTLFNTGGAISSLRKNPLKYILVPFFIVSQCISLLKVCKDEKATLIHSHWIIPQGFSGLIVSKLLNIPHVITIHGGDVFFFNYFLGRYLKILIAMNADHIVCNSHVSKNKLLSIVDLQNKVSIIPAPVEIEQFEKVIKNINKVPASFLFAGRLVEEKGILFLLKAFYLLVKEIPSATLTIVGDGPDKVMFQNFVRENNIPNVLFTGWIKHELLPEIYAKAWTYVGISTTSREGWQEAMGISYIEALAARCNVVCNVTAGYLTLISSNENIYTVLNPYDLYEIKDKMKNSLAHFKLNKTNISNFSSSEVSKAYIKIYDSISSISNC